MNEKRCGDCEYFVAFRNMNYETCTCDTITEYCELLQNEETYDRDKGDEIWNDVFDDCPLNNGYVSTESVIKLLQSKKEVRKQFNNYVRISCEKEKKLQDENEQLKEEIRAYPINEQYAKEIMQQNQKLRIERNDLRRENEQLRKEKIEANAFIVENGLAEEFVKWTTCIVGENDE